MGSPRAKIATRVKIPGTIIGRGADISSEGVDPEMQKTLGISGEPENPVTKPAPKPKPKAKFDLWKLIGVKH